MPPCINAQLQLHKTVQFGADPIVVTRIGPRRSQFGSFRGKKARKLRDLVAQSPIAQKNSAGARAGQRRRTRDCSSRTLTACGKRRTKRSSGAGHGISCAGKSTRTCTTGRSATPRCSPATLTWDQWFSVYSAVRAFQQVALTAPRDGTRITEDDRENLQPIIEDAIDAVFTWTTVALWGPGRRVFRRTASWLNLGSRRREAQLLEELGIDEDDLDQHLGR
jgi:hypothetical protein